MIEKIYLQYAEMSGDISATELELSEKKRSLEEIKNELLSTGDGGVGLDLTAHAFTNISDRISSIAAENVSIYADVFNPSNPSKAILWPNNLRAFIISMIANARSKGSFTEKQSRSSKEGTEYKYDVEIKKWSNDRSVLVFTAIVESNVVKTGYFNWVDRGRE
jgi:hypothetical protein